jgi:hypothetical protein
MKALLIFLCLCGCGQKKVVIQNAGDVEGRKTYHVKVGNVTYEYMYAEEIANGLKTGDWLYNEDLKIESK